MRKSYFSGKLNDINNIFITDVKKIEWTGIKNNCIQCRHLKKQNKLPDALGLNHEVNVICEIYPKYTNLNSFPFLNTSCKWWNIYDLKDYYPKNE